jgi:hypothetical protein
VGPEVRVAAKKLCLEVGEFTDCACEKVERDRFAEDNSWLAPFMDSFVGVYLERDESFVPGRVAVLAFKDVKTAKEVRKILAL